MTGSAKRVATVTALSPMVLVAVAYVLIENLRLLRALATLYGGRPGFVGVMRLARMVFAHIVATGGIAMTDDLLGQFLGQDLLRRLSRRLGEGAFNGALTARAIVSQSKGMSVRRSMTRVLMPSFSACCAASSERCTSAPHVSTVTSEPSRRIAARAKGIV